MSKTSNPSLLKNDIAESLILLLHKKPLSEISIKELTEKAGVNRSTYYRHFENKTEVVRHYYCYLLDCYLSTITDDITAMDYLTGMFSTFFAYKKSLILLDKYGMSYLLLEEMNSRIPQKHGDHEEADYSLYFNYHIGGVFNSYRYWLKEDMTTSPEDLAKKCLSFLPDSFVPVLI